ncbi:MAG TPA: circularly permuted type 2 ATP-grasp protein, partial [Propionibacteriaceae bacterium]|nr:circularly permuted type 2 ATP-grasp protein [Propionibacteriaceae bacterium]
GGKGIVIGPASTRAQLDQLRERILADPRGWIAQPVVQLSTVPTMIDGRLAPRHVDLRPFAVNDGSEVWVLPGGLTRVALPEGELIVNSSQGGGSKDTWVLADGAVDTPEDLAPAAIPDAVGLVVQPDHHLRTEHTPQQEQQQQHRQAHAEEAPC